ncbi:Mediator of RNA polymerase II transcription subunit 23 [Halocaridina rubra]|uniref:Mediator of RNA polymerase II transcription subunit 23 n=1 Tax=Halocaridina rubra TaxID=373956 RepID=A0AAN9A101_HALRR
MGLPCNPSIVANMLLDVLLNGYCNIPPGEVMEWVNAIGLVLTWLPEPYWIVIHDRIIELLQKPALSSPGGGTLDPFKLLNLDLLEASGSDLSVALTVAVAHSFWHHASFGQVGSIPQLIRERVRPILTTEEQLVVVCHLVGPFLQRFSNELARKVFDVTIELYEALAKVDHSVSELKYMDPICDVLYHIKYMFTGDSIKTDVEGIIRGLRPALQRRLRFITHLNLDAIENPSSVSTNVATPGSSSVTVSTSVSVTNSSSVSGVTATNSNTTSSASSGGLSGVSVSQATPSGGGTGTILGVPVTNIAQGGISSSGNMGSVGSISAASSLASLLQDTSPVNSSVP